MGVWLPGDTRMELKDAELCCAPSGSWASHLIQSCFQGGEVGAVGGEKDKAPQAKEVLFIWRIKKTPGVCARGWEPCGSFRSRSCAGKAGFSACSVRLQRPSLWVTADLSYLTSVSKHKCPLSAVWFGTREQGNTVLWTGKLIKNMLVMLFLHWVLPYWVIFRHSFVLLLYLVKTLEY